MAMPKKRMSHKRSGQRRNNPAKNLASMTLVVCSHCKQRALPHTACSHCGYYKGRLVIKK